MKNFMKKTLLITTFVTSTTAIAQEIPYPENYRSWHHIKSMVINPGHALYDAFGGIHHLYANKAALKGYQSGKFPDGAIIVFDLLEANDGGNALVEGNRKVVGVMQKNSKRYASTGGWGFEGFKGNSTKERVVGDNAASACFGCHEPQKKQDYVFSSTRK